MNKRETVIRQLLQRIRSGPLMEGNKLPPERELAESMGISRVLLREAIIVLETLGVLEVKERLGIFVREIDLSGALDGLRNMPFWSENFVQQLMEIRLIIDVHAAEFAALRRTEEQLSQLKTCMDALEKTSLASRESVRVHAHYEFLFHSLIVEAAQNAILSRIYEGLVSLMEKNNEILHVNFTKDHLWGELVIQHHRRTYTAIMEGNSSEAANSMRIHILESLRRYESMQKNGVFSSAIGGPFGP